MINPLKIRSVDFLPLDEWNKKLEKSKQTQTPLRIKLGVDPTSSDIHLGHWVVLRKLKEFQELGHQIIFVIGDYTAMIGDPSGRDSTRPLLSEDEIHNNAKTYQEQVFKILDKTKTQVAYNSTWLSQLTFKDTLELTNLMTVSQMLEREDFKKRFIKKMPISIREFLYPLMQGYDSLALNADVEIGGQDQKFNLLVGREIQKHHKKEEQVILTMPLLRGLDGYFKMSKSLNNYISITETPTQIFGKVMSIPDALMEEYFYLLTSHNQEFITQMKQSMLKGTNPKTYKLQLAQEIVDNIHGQGIGVKAKEEFETIFSKNKMVAPEDAVRYVLKETKLLIDIAMNLRMVDSRANYKRLLEQGAIRFNSDLITDINYNLNAEKKGVLKIGKKKFVKINLKD